MAFSTDPEHIAISKSKGVKIDWKDGHHSEYGLTWLRDKCPCATCTGAHGTTPPPAGHPIPAAYKNIITTYLANVAAASGQHPNMQARLASHGDTPRQPEDTLQRDEAPGGGMKGARHERATSACA